METLTRSNGAAVITVLALSSSPLMLAGLEVLLGRGTGRVILCPHGQRPDVILLDQVHDPVPRVVPTPGVPVVYLIDRADAAAVRAAARDQVVAIDVNADAAQIITALVEAVFISSHVVWPSARVAAASQDAGVIFSGRENDTINLLCTGLSNDQIASQLHVSVNTIKTYIRSAYRKMGVTTRSRAVIWALNNGYPRTTAYTASGPESDLRQVH